MDVAEVMSPSEIVQAQLDAYNAQDIDALCACFTPDAVLAELNGAITHVRLSGIRERYADLFAQHPHNRAEVLSRIAIGDVVIDEEKIRRGPTAMPFRAVAIYTIKSGLISRVDFVR
jgi:hypothetical protein